MSIMVMNHEHDGCTLKGVSWRPSPPRTEQQVSSCPFSGAEVETNPCTEGNRPAVCSRERPLPQEGPLLRNDFQKS